VNYWLYSGVIQESLPVVLEDADNMPSGALRVLLAPLRLEICSIWEDRLMSRGKLILQIAKEIDPCQRLIAVPGIGPPTATATIAAIVTDQLSRRAADLKPGWG